MGFHAKPRVQTINIDSDSDSDKTESEDDEMNSNKNRKSKIIKKENTQFRNNRKRHLSETMNEGEDYYNIKEFNLKVKRRKKSRTNNSNK